MHFNKRDVNSQNGVSQCNAGVGEGSWVENDEIDPVAGIMNKFDQLVLSVALGKFKLVAGSLGGIGQPVLNALQRFATVVFRFTTSQQIQVGAVQYQDGRHNT